MSASVLASTPPADAVAVLLVLLPPAAAGAAKPASMPLLTRLQQQLGSAIRVLTIDEASHPTVVRSFQATELPAFVLVQQGIELWRQQGLPEGESMVPLLLSKVHPAVIAK